MNRELLAKVRDRIAEVGNEHCNMHWYTRGEVTAAGEPECGTTACIAGYTLAVARGSFIESERNTKFTWISEEASRLLDLPTTAPFHIDQWPRRFSDIAHDEGHAKGMLALCDALLDGRVIVDAGWMYESDEDVS